MLLPEDKPTEGKKGGNRRLVESSILQGSEAPLSTLSEALHCCRGAILSPGTRSLTQMNNHTPYRHVGSIRPKDCSASWEHREQLFSVEDKHKCVHVRTSVCECMLCRRAYRGEKGAFIGLGKRMSKWWTFVRVMVMDGVLTSTPL